MNSNDTPALQEFEDVGDAIRNGRPLRPANKYRFRLANGNLEFHPFAVSDPVPLGRQILEGAGLDPKDGYSLFGILESGDFEDVRLDETFDLREHGVERFIAFLTDREFKLTLDDAELEWGKPVISGAVLYRLGEVGEDDAVFLRKPGDTDRLIEPDELIDLNEPGIEHFIVATRPPRQFEIFVNTKPHKVTGEIVTFEQIVAIAFPGPVEPNTVFSMSYRHAASQPHSGDLAAGGFVKVKNGTKFNVTRTIQS